MRCTGARCASASSTIVMTLPNVVSAPTCVTLSRMLPRVAMVAAKTRFPLLTSTGIDSPVKVAWLTVACPPVTSPSTGIDSPGRTITVSPTCTSPMGTTCSTPSRSTRAVCGARAVKRLTAWRERSVVKCST